jgi:hypothetical protein
MTDGEAPELEGGAEASSGRWLAGAAPYVFVGGTGRSGTHVLARLVSRHPYFALIPVEVRFHVEERGFPGLLAGTVSRDDFVSRLRGFWWKGFQTGRMRGMFRFVPEQRFEEAIAAFEAAFENDPEAACRQLFRDLLWFRAAQAKARGLVEQSTDTIAQAATLVRLFDGAKFIHVVRDGRDASASRVAQTRGVISPRTRRQGLEWWEERIRRADAGSRAIPPDRLLTVSLDELVMLGESALWPLCRFLGVNRGGLMPRFFRLRMSAERAHAERWREGVSEGQMLELERLYEQALERLEADGVSCAPLLRRTLERSRASGDDAPAPVAYVTGDGREVKTG